MKTLYLWENGWTPFHYNDLSDLKDEFAARGIMLGDGCKLGNGCKLGYGCKLGNGCELGYDCNVPKSLFISASRHVVSYWGADAIQIGCTRHTISEWQAHFRKIGEAENYTPEQIEEYKGYIDLIATLHKTWSIEKKGTEA
nr:MAG TPA: protein of unknown function (DUF4954) [Caudoviricetes sp.]